MTAISTKASSLANVATPRAAPPRKDDARPRSSSRKSPPRPSATEEEAKTRFVSALTKGVDTLLERGHGRERASAELLSDIADGCSPPDEDEIFQTMESLGISLEDATKVMTVSSAFRKAQIAQNGSAISAIDELTTRLNLADLSHHHKGSSRSPSPSPSAASIPSTPSQTKLTELTRNEFETTRAVAKKGQRPTSTRANNQQHQGRGRKRALMEKTPEKRDSNIMLEDPKKKVASAADLEVKEKMALNAKLSKAEGKKPKPGARAKSPEGGLGARGKRAAALHAEESQSNKRPRTRSQTEESIPAIL